MVFPSYKNVIKTQQLTFPKENSAMTKIIYYSTTFGDFGFFFFMKSEIYNLEHYEFNKTGFFLQLYANYSHKILHYRQKHAHVITNFLFHNIYINPWYRTSGTWANCKQREKRLEKTKNRESTKRLQEIYFTNICKNHKRYIFFIKWKLKNPEGLTEADSKGWFRLIIYNTFL